VSGELRAIKSAVVKVTDRCNQNCAFCLDKGVTPTMHMSVEEINALLDRLKLDCDQLIFMGGETLIIPDFERVISHAKEIGYKAVGIATNGTLLSKKGYLDRLLGAGLDYLEFSLIHHDPEKVSRLTGRKFTLARQIEALEQLNSRKYSERFFVLFNVVMNSVNRDDLLPICRWVNETYPGFPRRFNFKSMVLRGSALKNEWVRTRFSDIRLDAFAYLEECGIPFWTENMPLCVAPKFEWHSLNATTRVMDRRYKDINLEAPDEYYDTGFHDTGKVQPSVCEKCSLRAICLGIELGYIQIYGTQEFKPSRTDPVSVVGKVLAASGGDEGEAAAVHDGLLRFFRLPPYADKDRIYLYFRRGTHRRVTLMVAPNGEETRPTLRTGAHQIVFLGDGGPDRQPHEDEIELMKLLGRSVGFLDRHHPEEVITWCRDLKKQFEDGTLFPGNWVLLPESRHMRYY